ncbi:LptF/LptG family permease [Candidatus Pelagibacter sp.]|jgi:lipopolysaccharide export system permease protein|nr:LptF/LptG family permease [Candidatus Pelagibacter sp.]
MKKIIFRKLLLDSLRFFVLSLLTLSVIIWVLQAVNYLDFVIEDGHGFLVYLKYTLFSFPKILSKIFPFTLFFSIAYILLKYEEKNELIIFWNFGISKIIFINFFIKFSFLFLILSLLLNSLIVPSTLDKSRGYLRSSNLDFFESILKPKKFIDIVKNLTIFFEEKTKVGDLKNIFLKDNSKSIDGGYQVTFAKIGKLEMRGSRKVLVLYNGKTLIKQNDQSSEFKFDKTDFNLANFDSKTNSQIKTQENSTKQLLLCILKLKKIDRTNVMPSTSFIFTNCSLKNLNPIYKELYGRLVVPFYTLTLVMIPLLLILKSKNDSSFRYNKFKVFILGFLFIIFIEASSNFVRDDIEKNYFVMILPFIFYLFLHTYLIKKLRTKN